MATDTPSPESLRTGLTVSNRIPETVKKPQQPVDLEVKDAQLIFNSDDELLQELNSATNDLADVAQV